MASLVEGRNAVLESLRSGAEIERILMANGADGGKAFKEIARLSKERGITVSEVPRAKLDSLSVRGAHQGVIAEIAPFEYVTITDILSGAGDKERALILVLDHITDPQNLGAIARSAEVAGAEGLVIPSNRSATVGPAALKASAGALMHIPVAMETNIVRAIERCKDVGFWVAGADESAPQDVWSAPLDGRIALVLGSEDTGLSRLAQERCDFLVSLPVSGQVGSLNVAQAATALSFEWVRRGRGAS